MPVRPPPIWTRAARGPMLVRTPRDDALMRTPGASFTENPTHKTLCEPPVQPGSARQPLPGRHPIEKRCGASARWPSRGSDPTVRDLERSHRAWPRAEEKARIAADESGLHGRIVHKVETPTSISLALWVSSVLISAIATRRSLKNEIQPSSQCDIDAGAEDPILDVAGQSSAQAPTGTCHGPGSCLAEDRYRTVLAVPTYLRIFHSSCAVRKRVAAGQAAYLYSLMTPPSTRVRRSR
jgi:hypothetical protein